MSSRIEHWERKYRLRRAVSSGQFDALATAVLAVYDRAIDDAMPAGEVVVVKEVLLRLVLTPSADSEADLARTWGQAMAAAVLRAAASGEDPRVARFQDRAAHKAAFLAAAAEGRSTDHWMYARFATHRRSTPGETVAVTLIDEPAAIPATLRRLHESGLLPRVLEVLGPLAGKIWKQAIVGQPISNESQRPLFAAALRIVELLASRSFSRVKSEEWFADFAENTSCDLDWSDRASLAEGVAAAVRFVVARSPLAIAPSSADLRAAVETLDWLDIVRLQDRLAAEFSPASPRAKVVRPAVSGRRREWTEAVHRARSRVGSTLDRGHPSAAAMHVLAAVLADHPEWADDDALPTFIESTLTSARLERPASPRFEPVPSLVDVCSEGVPTACAGVFLLLRVVRDLRLHALAHRAELPTAFLTLLAARWAGLPIHGEVDPGLLAFGQLDGPFDLGPWNDAGITAFSSALLHTVRGQRLITEPEPLSLAVVPAAGGWVAFVGSEAAQVWPFAVPLDSPGEIPAIAHVSVDLSPQSPPASLVAAVESLDGESTGHAAADAVLLATALTALRAWARWLPRFDRAGVPYLLGQFIRRPGRLFRDDSGWTVELEPRPLDVALQMAGYLDAIDPLPGATAPRIRFRLGGG